MGLIREPLNKCVIGRIAALGPCWLLAYLSDMSVAAAAGRLALHPAITLIQKLPGRFFALLLAVSLTVGGCSSSGVNPMRSLVKSDIDMVNEVHYRAIKGLLEELTRKLYLRNPAQLKRGAGKSIEQRLDQLFRSPKQVVYQELAGNDGIDAMQLAFKPDFHGDRVFAMMAGLAAMINKSYGYRSEFYLLDEPLDEVQLYKSARNIEVLVWMLASRRDGRGNPFIITNNLSGSEPVNISFERLFGKLIATQDNMAVVAAEKNQRLIKTIVHRAASMVFIPL